MYQTYENLNCFTWFTMRIRLNPWLINLFCLFQCPFVLLSKVADVVFCECGPLCGQGGGHRVRQAACRYQALLIGADRTTKGRQHEMDRSSSGVNKCQAEMNGFICSMRSSGLVLVGQWFRSSWVWGILYSWHPLISWTFVERKWCFSGVKAQKMAPDVSLERSDFFSAFIRFWCESSLLLHWSCSCCLAPCRRQISC